MATYYPSVLIEDRWDIEHLRQHQHRQTGTHCDSTVLDLPAWFLTIV